MSKVPSLLLPKTSPNLLDTTVVMNSVPIVQVFKRKSKGVKNIANSAEAVQIWVKH